MVRGNAYDLETSTTNIKLPNNLEDAINGFTKNKIMHEILGSAWVDHFTVTREWEVKIYEEQKSCNIDWKWMLNRYFEII